MHIETLNIFQEEDTMKDFKEFIDRRNDFFKTESGTTEFQRQAYSLVDDLLHELAT